MTSPTQPTVAPDAHEAVDAAAAAFVEELATETFAEPEVDASSQVEENLSPLDAIQRYARSNWDVQRLAYIRGIAVATEIAGWRASRNLLPLLRELVGLPDTAVRQALAAQLTPMAKSWVKDGGQDGYTDAMELLDLGLHLIGDESEEVAQGGRDAVLGMAAILVPADVPRLLAALDELACFPDEDVRQSVVIMLAGLTGLLPQSSCTEMLLPRVSRLIEDSAYLVRKESATALAEMASAVTPEACESWCVRGIVTLSKDRVWAVRVAAAAAIPAVAAGAEPGTRMGVLRQRLEALVSDVSKWVRPVARHSLGPFLATLQQDDISVELLRLFTDTACARGEDATALQVACAANLPEVANAVGPERWPELRPALLSLASASEAATRESLASNLYRLAQLLPSSVATQDLLPITEALVNDAEAAVQQAVAQNCADLLAAFPASSRAGLLGQMRDVAAASRCAWRTRLGLAEQLDRVALLFDIEDLEAEVVPVAKQLCRDAVADVRVAAADQLGQLLASEDEGARHRAQILAKSLRVLSNDQGYQMRQVYIHMCARVIGLVEPDSFQQDFLGPLLNLVKDPVPNVRLALARMLAGADLSALPHAAEALFRLRDDPDRDTAQFARASEEAERVDAALAAELAALSLRESSDGARAEDAPGSEEQLAALSLLKLWGKAHPALDEPGRPSHDSGGTDGPVQGHDRGAGASQEEGPVPGMAVEYESDEPAAAAHSSRASELESIAAPPKMEGDGSDGPPGSGG